MKTSTGVALILVALAMLAINISDAIADLRDWHGVTTPLFVSVFLKQAGSVVVAAVGGTLLPQPSKRSD